MGPSYAAATQTVTSSTDDPTSFTYTITATDVCTFIGSTAAACTETWKANGDGYSSSTVQTTTYTESPYLSYYEVVITAGADKLSSVSPLALQCRFCSNLRRGPATCRAVERGCACMADDERDADHLDQECSTGDGHGCGWRCDSWCRYARRHFTLNNGSEWGERNIKKYRHSASVDHRSKGFAHGWLLMRNMRRRGLAS